MTDVVDVNAKQTLVAIDIAKQSHDAVIHLPNGKTKTVKFLNNRAGYQQLLAHCGDPASGSIRAGFEPTADYHRNLAYWLQTHGVDCFLVSSLSCARARELLYKTWDKHDRKDAQVILYLLMQGMAQPFHDPLLSGTMDTQELSNTYHQVSLARTRCQHSLVNHYLTLYFPEMERYFHNSRSEWFCRFLLKYPTPGTITRFKKSTFVKRAWEVVGRKVAKQRFLEELYETAMDSIGLPLDPDSIAVATFKLQVSRYLALTVERKELEAMAEQFLAGRDDYQRLRTLPGVGPIIALMILAESGDLTRFRHYRQYLNYCGFNLSAIRSGRTQGQYQLSKRGNARLRYAFWLAAVNATRQRENSFRYKFERYIRTDPSNADLKRKGRVAVASKIARVAHALVKQNVDYRGFYEVGHGT
ncbi:MAG: IS110 family transposase [Gammaproteobacteria bacterium]|nr:IS110 family transposase [Gammaproteobacteria bacterium]